MVDEVRTLSALEFCMLTRRMLGTCCAHAWIGHVDGRCHYHLPWVVPLWCQGLGESRASVYANERSLVT